MAGIDLNDTVEEDEEEAEPGNACSQQSRTSSAATPPPPPPPQPRPGAAVCLELWHACAGPVAPLPRKGSVVVYLPQGHLEHLGDAAGGGAPAPAALPPHVFCRVVDVTLHVRALVPASASSSLCVCPRAWVAHAGAASIDLPSSCARCRRTRPRTRCTPSSPSSPRTRCAEATVLHRHWIRFGFSVASIKTGFWPDLCSLWHLLPARRAGCREAAARRVGGRERRRR